MFDRDILLLYAGVGEFGRFAGSPFVYYFRGFDLPAPSISIDGASSADQDFTVQIDICPQGVPPLREACDFTPLGEIFDRYQAQFSLGTYLPRSLDLEVNLVVTG